MSSPTSPHLSTRRVDHHSPTDRSPPNLSGSFPAQTQCRSEITQTIPEVLSFSFPRNSHFPQLPILVCGVSNTSGICTTKPHSFQSPIPHILLFWSSNQLATHVPYFITLGQCQLLPPRQLGSPFLLGKINGHRTHWICLFPLAPEIPSA